MANFTERTRNPNLKWWQEENEKPLGGTRFTEAYQQANFGPGWDGVGAPPSKEMGSGYAKNNSQGRNYDPLSGKGATSTKSGGGFPNDGIDGKDFKEKGKKSSKVVKEGFGGEGNDFEDEDNFDGGVDQDQGFDDGGDFEDDGVPAGVGGEGDDFGGEGSGVADEVTVEIEGKTYKLVPVDDGGEEGGDFGGEGDLGGEEDFGDEAFDDGQELGAEEGEDDELGRHGGIQAEKKDLTQEKKNSRVKESKIDKVIDEAISRVKGNSNSKPTNAQKEAAIQGFIKLKTYSEQKLKELFTGKYVVNKNQGSNLAGFDFSAVKGDPNFAIVDAAHTGKQYSPTISDSVWEPGKDSKGGSTAHAVTPKKESAKDEFERWMKVQEKKLAEADETASVDSSFGSNSGKDPGEASSNFNRKDNINSVTPGGNADADSWPAVPEILGANKETISQFGEKKTRKTESTEKLNESSSFDFKKFINGEYSK